MSRKGALLGGPWYAHEQGPEIRGGPMESARKLVLYIAQSLDGYIAREDESLDWLLKFEGPGDNGYTAFYETVDTILLGRRTYEWILRNVQSDFPYQGKTCYVFSRTLRGQTASATFVNQDIAHFTASPHLPRGILCRAIARRSGSFGPIPRGVPSGGDRTDRDLCRRPQERLCRCEELPPLSRYSPGSLGRH